MGDQMKFTSLQRDELDEKKLPDSIYKSVVSSLYGDPNSLAIGIVSCILVALVLFWKTLDSAQLIFATLFFVVGAARLFLTGAFYKAVSENLSIKLYQRWENRYNIIGSIYLSILGFWYINGLVTANDSYVQLASLALILCYLSGIIGRNFASYKVVRSQVIIAIFFLIGGTLVFDKSHGVYGVLLALFLLPYLVATYKMSASLRGTLFKAEINALNNRTTANRFDVALDNVAHGIAMIDETGTVVVANDRFMELAGLKDWEIVGCNISILQTIEIGDVKHSTLGRQIEACLKENETAKFAFTLMSGVVIEAEYNSMIDGGVIVLSDVSERKASEKVIKDLANFDALTNLSNRRYFIERVESYLARSKGASSSMYFIDLDKFKVINDTLGHAIGDELLRVIAARLKVLISSDTMICRFGGDEFVIFCPGFGSPIECAKFADLILRELHLPVVVRNHHIDIGGSIGIALSPDHGTNANVLLQHADAALYESKARGRSICTFYTDALGDAISNKRQLETDLRKAVKNDEIELHYQPLFDVKKCTITGCEALARWQHPTLGNIPPGQFIELAEEMGLIIVLGKQLMRKAMLECKKWPDDMRVGVNVSSIQFQKSNVYKTVKKLLDDTGLPAGKLNIEVTESTMIDSIEDISVTLTQLSNLGVNISLDDFGTGFSSLSYLHTLPFDKVKIDKSFVENGVASERSLILLQGVVDLIKRLGLKIVLEGIETQEQLNVMEKSIDVHEYQGFLFFKPMDAESFFELAHRSNAGNRDNITKLVYSK